MSAHAGDAAPLAHRQTTTQDPPVFALGCDSASAADRRFFAPKANAAIFFCSCGRDSWSVDLHILGRIYRHLIAGNVQRAGAGEFELGASTGVDPKIRVAEGVDPLDLNSHIHGGAISNQNICLVAGVAAYCNIDRFIS